MPLTKQQLLIPRVLCIGGKEGEPNYPGSMVKTGEVLTLCTGITNGRYYESKDGHLIHLPLNFPNCFKPLPWLYGRTMEEMPEYITVDGDTLKAEEYDLYPPVVNGVSGLVWVRLNEKLLPIDLRKAAPADLSDYLEYQKQKEA